MSKPYEKLVAFLMLFWLLTSHFFVLFSACFIVFMLFPFSLFMLFFLSFALSFSRLTEVCEESEPAEETPASSKCVFV